MPTITNMPRIYLAGKISKNCWRHNLIPALRGWEWEEGPLPAGAFTYVGPFFVACDHGCRHRPGTHGASGMGCDGENITRASVFKRNQAALSSADIVFAYIESPDCPGTIAEIGWAASRGIPVYLFFAPGVDHDDFWYLARMGVGAPATCIAARDDLPRLLETAIADWKRR